VGAACRAIPCRAANRRKLISRWSIPEIDQHQDFVLALRTAVRPEHGPRRVRAESNAARRSPISTDRVGMRCDSGLTLVQPVHAGIRKPVLVSWLSIQRCPCNFAH
jgi:hypothetical protein